MTYKERAETWYKRALEEKDEFVKFLLLFISLEVSMKTKFKSIRDVKRDNSIKDKFYSKIDYEYLKKLKNKLDKNPLINMKPKVNRRLFVKLKSADDFESIIDFVMIARHNLFHGDKVLDEKRDAFIVKEGSRILQPLVKAIIL